MAEGRQGGAPLLHPFPCLCCLFGQGCLRGVRLLRQREAEWDLPPAGETVGHRGKRGTGAKHVPQPWPRGRERSTAIEGSESKKKKTRRRRMVVAR